MQCSDCEFFVLEVCSLSLMNMNPNEYFSDRCKLRESCKQWEQDNNFREGRTCSQCDFYTADMVCCLDGETHEADEDRGVCELINEYRNGVNGEPLGMNTSGKLTFEDVVNIEVGVLEIAKEIEELKTRELEKNFCADKVWSRNFKPRMCRMVGWESKHEELRDEYVFQMVYRKLYNLMPMCGDCDCGCEQELFEREGKNDC